MQKEKDNLVDDARVIQTQRAVRFLGCKGGVMVGRGGKHWQDCGGCMYFTKVVDLSTFDMILVDVLNPGEDDCSDAAMGMC